MHKNLPEDLQNVGPDMPLAAPDRTVCMSTDNFKYLQHAGSCWKQPVLECYHGVCGAPGWRV